MNLSHPFPQRVRLLFLYEHRCWECGRNGSTSGGLELHHIWGRVSGAALNAAPLCHECHERVLHTRDEHLKYLRITIDFLSTSGYVLCPTDHHFLELVKTDLRGFTAC